MRPSGRIGWKDIQKSTIRNHNIKIENLIPEFKNIEVKNRGLVVRRMISQSIRIKDVD